jgi:Na+-driven multidrug efflux pump
MNIGWRTARSFGARREDDAMQTLMTAITVTAGMAFSLAIAILVEELIFGKVFGLFFARQAVQIKSGQER